MKTNKQIKTGTAGNRRFLINALVLIAAAGLIAWRMPGWGVMQVLILLLIVGMAAFQLILFFKLK